MDSGTIETFLRLKNDVGQIVSRPELAGSDAIDRMHVIYEFGSSIEFSLEEQRRKIADKEASPESLVEAMGELSCMIEEFNSIARRLLSRVESTSFKTAAH